MSVTPVAEWGAQDEEITLPSGKIVKLRRPDIINLIDGNGDVPDVLTNMILGMIDRSGGGQSVDINRESLPEIMRSLNVIARAAFVYPRLWEQDYAEGDCIPLSWVTFNDKAWVFAWALGVKFEPAASFRPEQNGAVPVVSALPGLPAKPRRGARTHR